MFQGISWRMTGVEHVSIFGQHQSEEEIYRQPAAAAAGREIPATEPNQYVVSFLF